MFLTNLPVYWIRKGQSGLLLGRNLSLQTARSSVSRPAPYVCIMTSYAARSGYEFTASPKKTPKKQLSASSSSVPATEESTTGTETPATPSKLSCTLFAPLSSLFLRYSNLPIA